MDCTHEVVSGTNQVPACPYAVSYSAVAFLEMLAEHLIIDTLPLYRLLCQYPMSTVGPCLPVDLVT